MITLNEITSVGKFNKTHGINGEISASINAPINAVRKCSCIVCNIDGILVPFFINGIRSKSSETFLFDIDDINNEQDAMMLVNKDINVLRSEYSSAIDDEEQLPLDFLIGFNTIVNKTQEGKIVDIDDSTANVLLVIELTNGNTALVPAVEEFINYIDSKQRIIELEVPEDLLDL